MAWFVIFIMAFGVLGLVGGGLVGLGNGQDSAYGVEEYNGFTFTRDYNHQWIVEVNGQNFGFSYFPTELENIILPETMSGVLGAEKVYLGFMPEDEIDVTLYRNVLRSVLALRGKFAPDACMVDEGCGDLPLLDCEVSEGIVLQHSEDVVLSSEGKCVVVEAPNAFELQKITERIIYTFLGVMN